MSTHCRPGSSQSPHGSDATRPGLQPVTTGARNGARQIQTRDLTKAPGSAGAGMETPAMPRSVLGGGHCFTIRICLMRASRRLPGRRQLRAEQVDLRRSARRHDWSFHCRAC
jgi:hypothetical protein